MAERAVQAVHSGLPQSQVPELVRLCSEVTSAVDLAEARVKARPACQLPGA